VDNPPAFISRQPTIRLEVALWDVDIDAPPQLRTASAYIGAALE